MKDRDDSIDEHATLARVLRAVIPSLLAVSCGTTTSAPDSGASDASDEPAHACGGCGCEGGASTDYSTTYAVCPSADAGADASDAAASIDAASCYASCGEACLAASPTQGKDGVMCLSEAIDGGVSVAQCEDMSGLCTGRRTEGLVAPTSRRSESLGEALAHLAWLEAASVHAFRRLARELTAHGAPRVLVAAARSAARDEIRHARTMRTLAARHGARVPSVVAGRSPVRDLESIARENAIEACVAETFGAVLAAWQSERASDDDVREAMRAIAPDELRHASLGWSVATWIEPRLSPDARRRVDRARERAVSDCLRSTTRWPASTRGPLGLPSDETTHVLARELVASRVWKLATS